MSVGHGYTKPITASKQHICLALMRTILKIEPLGLIAIGAVPHAEFNGHEDQIAFSVETIDSVDDMPVPLWLVFDFKTGTCWLTSENKVRCSHILTLAQGELSTR